MKKLILKEMTWAEAEEALKETDTIIVPTAALDPHGRHRPLGDDIYMADEFAYQIAKKLNPQAIVAPTITAGPNESYMGWPGTVTVRHEVFREYLKDIVRSLYSHGWKKVVIVNTHGGSRVHLQIAAGELKRELKDFHIVVAPCEYLSTTDVKLLEELGLTKDQTDPVHGGEFTTSIMMTIEKKLGLKLVCKEKAEPPTPKEKMAEYRQLVNAASVAYIPSTTELLREYTNGLLYKTDLNKTASAEKGAIYLDKVTTHMAKKIQYLLDR